MDRDHESLRWEFDTQPRGTRTGFNDSSQELFRDDPWEHAVRELIQNSLDAAESRNSMVNVQLQVMQVGPEDIRASELIPHFEQALQDEEKSHKAQTYFKRALKLFREDTIDVLAVTDTNTTGLRDELWNALVHEEGRSHKNTDVSGGSYGIGKNAPYAVSSIRTVFYYTSYQDGGTVEKFTGRCKLVTHHDPNNQKKLLNNIGLCVSTDSSSDDVLPVKGDNIPSAFRLRGSGGSTSVFVIGFNPRVRDWKHTAVQSVVRNFFVAILEGKLQVKIDNMMIDKNRLEGILAEDRSIVEWHYYETVRNPEYTRIIESGIGNFKLRFSVGRDDYPSQLVYINRMGMKITDAKQVSKNPFTPMLDNYHRYVAVVQADDDATDIEIRKMEPPNHKAIEYKSVDDRSLAEIKRIMKDMRDKITDEIRNAVDLSDQQDIISSQELAKMVPMVGGDGSGHGIAINVSRKPVMFGPRGTDVGIIGDGGRTTTPTPTPTPTPKPPRPYVPGKENTERRGRKNKSIFERVSVKRNGNTLRVWLEVKSGTESARFCICPAGEQIVDEGYVRPTAVHIVYPPEMKFELKNSDIIVKSPLGKIIMNLDIDGAAEYTGYVVKEIRENSGKEAKN